MTLPQTDGASKRTNAKARSCFARMMSAKFRNGEEKFEIFEKRTFLFFCKVFTFSPILTSMKLKLIRINKLFVTPSKR